LTKKSSILDRQNHRLQILKTTTQIEAWSLIGVLKNRVETVVFILYIRFLPLRSSLQEIMAYLLYHKILYINNDDILKYAMPAVNNIVHYIFANIHINSILNALITPKMDISIPLSKKDLIVTLITIESG
jgi:hypothetical protein